MTLMPPHSRSRRVSIYGRKLSEWDKLARWFYVHQLAHPCVRWLIQIPRLYHLYRRMGEVTSFQVCH